MSGGPVELTVEVEESSVDDSQSTPSRSKGNKPPKVSRSRKSKITSERAVQSHSSDRVAEPVSPATASLPAPLTGLLAAPLPAPLTGLPLRSAAEPDEAKPKPLDLRKLVLKELFTTENDYVNDVSFMIEVYVKQLRDRPDLLPRDQIPAIFSNIELLKSVNSALLSQIRDCWTPQSNRTGIEIVGLGEIFLDHANRLKVYDQYCNNHPTAVEALMKARSDHPRFAAFLDSQLTKDNFPIDLRDYLIKPVQRICKYPLLVREIIKHTPEEHADYPLLQQTMAMLQAVAKQINQTKREYENKMKISEIEKQIEGLGKIGRLLVPGRFFYREGVLSKVNPKGVIQSRNFCLFSDILIWSKKGMGGGKSVFKGSLRLDLAVCRVCPDDEKKKIRFAFQIIRVDTKKIYTLMADNEEEKLEWMKDVDRIINRHLGVGDDEDPFIPVASAASSSPPSQLPNQLKRRDSGASLRRLSQLGSSDPSAPSSSPLSPLKAGGTPVPLDPSLFLTQLQELEELFKAEQHRRQQLEEHVELLMQRILELEQKRK